MSYLAKAVLVIGFFSFQVQAADFPETWEGQWEGVVTTEKGASKMRLRIEPLPEGKHSWVIQYEKEPERPYELLTKDLKTGHFQVDEKNGSVIDHFYKGGSVSAAFTINGKLVVFVYEMTKDGIQVSAPMFDITTAHRTGIRTVTGVIPVHSFALLGIQLGLLKKVP